MTEERTGEAFELGEQLTVVGRKLMAGDSAPDFTLDHFDGESMHTVALADTTGKIRVVNTVNSIDTAVCHVETQHWDEIHDALPADVVVYTVSMDLPFALDRWRRTTGSGHILISAHDNEGFGRDYGVLIKQWRLLQRAVFVIAGNGTIVHAEYVSDQMAEPDYESAIVSARAAVRPALIPARDRSTDRV